MSDRPLPLRSPSSPPPISIGRFPRLCSILVKSMARFRNSLLKWQAPVLIWTSSLVLFYFIYRIAMDQSALDSLDDGSTMSSSELRARLYDKMAKDLDDKGVAFLKGGETSQSLSLSDLFEVKDGSVTPRLKAADPLVRANVLYLSPEFSLPISKAVKEIFLPYFDGGQGGRYSTNSKESHQNHGGGDGVGLCDKPTASNDSSSKAQATSRGESSLLKADLIRGSHGTSNSSVIKTNLFRTLMEYVHRTCNSLSISV